MFLLAQINFGSNLVSFAGLFYLVLTLIHLVILRNQNKFRRWALLFYLGEVVALWIAFANLSKIIDSGSFLLYFSSAILVPLVFMLLATFGFYAPAQNIFNEIVELIIMPNMLFFGGLILIFQGWRLDPILQTQAIWMLILISYLVFKTAAISSRTGD